MGRGRGKGKRHTTIDVREDAGSGEEEKLPTQKRRGRPQKVLKDETEKEDETEKIEEEDEKEEEEENGGENTKGSISNKDTKNQVAEENGRKRKRTSQAKGYPVKEENGMGTKTTADNSIRSVGFRQNGSRRKNKPRRAAEVGVECK